MVNYGAFYRIMFHIIIKTRLITIHHVIVYKVTQTFKKSASGLKPLTFGSASPDLFKKGVLINNINNIRNNKTMKMLFILLYAIVTCLYVSFIKGCSEVLITPVFMRIVLHSAAV